MRPSAAAVRAALLLAAGLTRCSAADAPSRKAAGGKKGCLVPMRAQVPCCGPGAGEQFNSLAEGLHTIRATPVDKLFEAEAVTNIVRHIGLQPSDRRIGKRLGHENFSYSIYGEEAVYQKNMTGAKMWGSGIGMWQVPQQFECLIQTLRTAWANATAAGLKPTGKTLCVGTWTGWTDLVLAELLRRFVSPTSHHYTFDITSQHVSQCVRTIMHSEHHNVTHLAPRGGWRGTNDSWALLGIDTSGIMQEARRAVFAEPVLDFCLIDGDHAYAAVMRDFDTLRTACRMIAFHDVVNIRVGLQNSPKSWRDLTTPGGPQHAPEFASFNCLYQPQYSDGRMMGIGVLVRKESPATAS